MSDRSDSRNAEKQAEKTLLEKLIKVLALADSAQEGEALAALRAGRLLMEKLQLNFADLVLGAFRAKQRRVLKGDGSEEYWQALQEQVAKLQRHNAALQQQLDATARRAESSLRTAEMAAAALAKSRTANQQWRTLARDTAEKLWDLGQQMETARVQNADTPENRRQAALQFLEETQALLRRDDMPDLPANGRMN